MRKIPDLSHVNKGLNFYFFEKGVKGGLWGGEFWVFVLNMTDMTLMIPTPKTYPWEEIKPIDLIKNNIQIVLLLIIRFFKWEKTD